MVRYLSPRSIAGVLVAGLLVTSWLAPRTPTAPSAYAAAGGGQGNSGDVKISETTQPAHGNEGNEPHVQCQFYVLGFNMDVSQGTITVSSWPPTGDGTTVLTDAYAGTPDDKGTYQFVTGPYTLAQGHYKLFVTDNKGDEVAKQKVFWVDSCPATPTPVSPTDTATTVPPSATATSVPPPATSTPCISTTMCGPGVTFTASLQATHLLRSPGRSPQHVSAGRLGLRHGPQTRTHTDTTPRG